MNELINYIILKYIPSYKYSNNYNEHWNWITKYKHKSSSIIFSNFKDYINFNKKIQHIANKYYKIYNWLHRRLFINKCIKLVEFYWRPNNPGYLVAFNNFIKNINKMKYK